MKYFYFIVAVSFLVFAGCRTKQDSDPRKLKFIDVTFDYGGWGSTSVYIDSTQTLIFRPVFGIYPDTIARMAKLGDEQYARLEKIIFALDTCRIDTIYPGLVCQDCPFASLIIKTRKKIIRSAISGGMPFPILDSLMSTLGTFKEWAKNQTRDTGFHFLSDPRVDVFRPYRGNSEVILHPVSGLILVPGATYTMGKNGTDEFKLFRGNGEVILYDSSGSVIHNGQK